MTAEIKRLVDEFNAQDVGAFLVVHVLGKHVRVAAWQDGNKVWMILPDGKRLLSPEDDVESVDTLAGTDKKQNIRTRKTKSEPELELDDL